MTFKNLYTTKNTVVIIIMAVFFSCKNNFKAVQKIGLSANEPQGIAENINLKHTDSGRVTANLISPKMYDYNNRNFKYSEFTEGVTLHLFDKANKRSTILAEYAVTYSDTDLIDLRGNVIIYTAEKDTLFTNQLYYDQKNEWVFTNEPFKFLNSGNITEGKGFDSDRELNKLQILEIGGKYLVQEKP